MVCTRSLRHLSEAGMPTLTKMRDTNTVKIAIRFITNEIHPTRHYFINKNTHDEYASEPKTPKPIFVRVT
jgi:CTP synthase (UTP-ammonia lyase)